MRTRTIRILQALCGAAVPFTLLAFSTGPPIMRTGAAVDGGMACNVCHTSFPLNDSSGGSVAIRANAYTPGVKQLIEVEVHHPEAQRFGFQLTARLASDETKPAGTFTVDDNIRVRCAPAGADAPCTGALEFAEHKQPTTNAGSPGPRTFLIEWTPPDTNAGQVVLYAAGNAANNSGSTSGDHIYTTNATISPAATPSGALNLLSGALSIAPNSWISISGTNLATATRPWAMSDIVSGRLPTQLNGTGVKVNGKDAFVSSISPTLVNALTPPDDTTGDVTVQVINGSAVQSFTAHMQPYSPALFATKDNLLIAQHADFSLVTSASPAQPGETVILYGVGFGPTDPAPPAGQVMTGIATLTNPVKVRIGGAEAQPSFAGLSATGLYQLNVTIPASAAEGNLAVVATVGGFSTPGSATIPVRK